jgi:hypothetical protein
VWQKKFEQYGSDAFTVVGLALDAEGIAPAKIYYEKFGITFPSLVDPNYATRFTAVPKTIFVDELGIVQDAKDWESKLAAMTAPATVTDKVRSQWSAPGARLQSVAIAGLVARSRKAPDDLSIATQLGSRYLALGLHTEAQAALRRAVEAHDAKAVAREKDAQTTLLGQAYFQLARACEENREQQVQYATLSFYVAPSIGFGKQIARIIDPQKFDGRPQGDFDNRFREGTLRRLVAERKQWLAD